MEEGEKEHNKSFPSPKPAVVGWRGTRLLQELPERSGLVSSVPAAEQPHVK